MRSHLLWLAHAIQSKPFPALLSTLSFFLFSLAHSNSSSSPSSCCTQQHNSDESSRSVVQNTKCRVLLEWIWRSGEREEHEMKNYKRNDKRFFVIHLLQTSLRFQSRLRKYETFMMNWLYMCGFQTSFVSYGAKHFPFLNETKYADSNRRR